MTTRDTTPVRERMTRTERKYGRFYVYAYGPWRWYRCTDGQPRYPEWYLWRDDEQGYIDSPDGEYVDTNPANWPAWRLAVS